MHSFHLSPYINTLKPHLFFITKKLPFHPNIHLQIDIRYVYIKIIMARIVYMSCIILATVALIITGAGNCETARHLQQFPGMPLLRTHPSLAPTQSILGITFLPLSSAPPLSTASTSPPAH